VLDQIKSFEVKKVCRGDIINNVKGQSPPKLIRINIKKTI